jgi:hypothetical protein
VARVPLRRPVVVALALIALGAVPAAWAAVQNAGGMLYACASRDGGALRLLDAPRLPCADGEERVAWNRTGPVGPAGPAGPSGTAGRLYATSGGSLTMRQGLEREVAGLSVPAGRYLLTGKGQAVSRASRAEVVSCTISDSAGRILDASSASPAQPAPGAPRWSHAALVFQGAVELPEPRTLRVACTGADGTSVSARLAAQEVASITS